MKKLFFIFFHIFLFAQGEVYLKISRQQGKKIDIAIFPFALSENLSESLRIKLNSIENIVVEDLYFSLYFVITRSPEVLLKTNDPLNFQFWRDLGSQVLLKIKIEKNKPSFITAELIDLAFEKEISSQRIPLDLDTRKIAHKISNFVVQTLTGEEGIFETKIVFSVKTEEGRQLFIMDYDGANLKKLTEGGGEKLFPKWSFDGTKIVYATYIKKDRMALFLIDFKKNDISLFLDERKGLHIPGAWFLDGKFLSLCLSKDGNPEIYILNMKNKELKRLTNNPFIDISPYPSPSGREIAFVSDRSGSPQIYIMDREGLNIRRLTYYGSYNTSPAWSPKGDLIAYTSLEDGKNNIYIIDPIGENPQRLTYEGNNEDPSWSADGLHLVFRSDRDGEYDIYLMHWDGSEQKKITEIGNTYSPSWGPFQKQ